jgi:hypothetical protein
MPDAPHNSLNVAQSSLVSVSPGVLHPVSTADLAPTPELLSALGRLVRGLSLLFWGLPIALVVCVQTARGDWFRPLGVFPSLLASGLLLYALVLLGRFQKQERPWTGALDRARVLAVINLGLSPFLYWWNRIPEHPLFSIMIDLSMLCGLAFLFLLNPLINRLAAMLPDETLRQETKLFTDINCYFVLGIVLVLTAYLMSREFDPGLPARILGWFMQVLPLGRQGNAFVQILDRAGMWLLLFLVLLPLAMTMALIWKVKEVILASVFGVEH